ncbi:MAG: hypothetical protein IKE25_06310, partial [Clostridia bacterium]|nr:hypothetical protein [Clostridia bacterium]
MKHSTGLRNLFSGALFAAAHEGLNPGKNGNPARTLFDKDRICGMMSDGTGPIGHPRSRRSHDDDQAGFRNLLHIHSYIKLNQEDDP